MSSPTLVTFEFLLILNWIFVAYLRHILSLLHGQIMQAPFWWSQALDQLLDNLLNYSNMCTDYDQEETKRYCFKIPTDYFLVVQYTSSSRHYVIFQIILQTSAEYMSENVFKKKCHWVLLFFF